ncbi:dienelactone hydrolase family protein [Fictibacillus terranigra]|uniref:Dienelactone hydrolase family protein n=1 Tax=Fictibacillus terranigra TaxID=3058424 RepID=A0ABT8E883_9BACL|nr:dienelactone hydrolase family protein [Fictibacillus sp. CENA-BCM004]MDN4074088.1 dienelactone hydrolase family protein [Fictibacillus sp. CENA-BCM004]
MLIIQNQTDILIIVVHEIYGLNQHMIEVCECFSQQEFDVISPNLLGRETPFHYSEENLAYVLRRLPLKSKNSLRKVNATT